MKLSSTELCNLCQNAFPLSHLTLPVMDFTLSNYIRPQNRCDSLEFIGAFFDLQTDSSKTCGENLNSVKADTPKASSKVLETLPSCIYMHNLEKAELGLKRLAVMVVIVKSFEKFRKVFLTLVLFSQEPCI